MAKLSHLWMVIDPEPGSTRTTLADLYWHQDIATLPRQIFGGGVPRYWTDRNLAFYLDGTEAERDAKRRLTNHRKSLGKR